MLTYEVLASAYPYRPRKAFMPFLVLTLLGVLLGLCAYYIPNMWYIKQDIITASEGTEDLLNFYCLIGFIGGSVSIGLGLFICMIIGRSREKLGVLAISEFLMFVAILGFAIAYFVIINADAETAVILDNVPWIGMVAYYGMPAVASIVAVTLAFEAVSICMWPNRFEGVRVVIQKMLECYQDKKTRKQMKRRLKIDWKYHEYEHVLDDLYFPRVGMKNDNSPIERDVYEYIVYKQKQDYGKIKSTELDLLYAAQDFNTIRGRYYKAIQMTRARFEYHVGPNSRIARKNHKQLVAVSPRNAAK